MHVFTALWNDWYGSELQMKLITDTIRATSRVDVLYLKAKQSHRQTCRNKCKQCRFSEYQRDMTIMCRSLWCLNVRINSTSSSKQHGNMFPLNQFLHLSSSSCYREVQGSTWHFSSWSFPSHCLKHVVTLPRVKHQILACVCVHARRFLVFCEGQIFW